MITSLAFVVVACAIIPGAVSNRKQHRNRRDSLPALRPHDHLPAQTTQSSASALSSSFLDVNPADLPVGQLSMESPTFHDARARKQGQSHLKQVGPGSMLQTAAVARDFNEGQSNLKQVGQRSMLQTAAAAREDMMASASDEPLPVLMALGGGTGASIGGTGSSIVDHNLIRRMHYQDKAVLLLILSVYLVTLWFSASLTYRQACNNSPVTYYSNPRLHNLAMEGHELDEFMGTFNQAPKNITLQVSGFVPVTEEMVGNVHWRGENFQVAFTFSLDLSPWVVRESNASTSPAQQTRSLHDGVLPEDRSRLRCVLEHCHNDLCHVELVKEVIWPDWEELATNIKHRIRQSGFDGVIVVNRIDADTLQVHKNKPWANFMHSRSTRVLCALSVVGWLFYVPYMWLRCKKVSVKSHFKVDVSIAGYWPLIADKLTADGFSTA